MTDTVEAEGSGLDPDGSGAEPDHQEPVETDGRRRRRAQNREAVVDALLDLYRAGNLRPGTDEIAQRAGLSPRSLFRYFDDVDDLAQAAVRRQQIRALPLLPIDASPDSPLEEKARALVEQRFRLFDTVGQSARVVRLRSQFQPVLGAELSQNRAFLRQQLLDLFAPEVSRKDGPQAAAAIATIAAADVMCSFESFLLLTEDQSFDVPRAKAVMAGALTSILGSHGDAGTG